MFNIKYWQSGTAALMTLGITTSAVIPMIAPAPSFAQNIAFSDVPAGYWAGDFITQLTQSNIIAGFPDGTFRPDQSVTRAQFAAMVAKAFQKAQNGDTKRFVDVPRNYWAYNSIEQAYTSGFLSGLPGNRFEPSQNIPREQVLVALANGLKYSASSSPSSVLQYYNDAGAISDYARAPIAAATERQIVVNYPNLKFLKPTQTATRAQVAAFIYQALVSSGQATAITSPYIVALGPNPAQATQSRISSGTTIPVRYDQAKKILVSPNEKSPLTLTVAQDIVSSNGTVIIPAGSKVGGQLQPAQGGSQFVAQQLVLPNGQRYDLNATSQVITKTQDVTRGTNIGNVVRDALLGSAAAAGISGVAGDRRITAGKVLIGTGAGAVGGLLLDRNRVKVIEVDPNSDLNLTLGSDLVLSQSENSQ